MNFEKNMAMKNMFLGILACALFFSCEKREILVDNVDFEVSVEQGTYHVGDTVVFHFSGGSPDILTFYSGEGSSNEEDFVDRYVDAGLSLSFQSAKFAGTNEDCVSLKYSTDFTGIYTEEAIRAATWVDISNRFDIPPIVGTGAVFSSSGTSNITDLFEDKEKPVYFGWFYTIKDRSANDDERRTRFRVQNFNLSSFAIAQPGMSEILYDFTSSAFQLVTSAAYEAAPPTGGVPVGARPRFLGSSLYFDGPFNNEVFREAWAISTAVYLPESFNIGPVAQKRSTGIGVKAFNEPMVSSYEYIYKEPGTYVVSFVGQNTNIYNNKQAVRQIKITVGEPLN